jgi:hypothetical protein
MVQYDDCQSKLMHDAASLLYCDNISYSAYAVADVVAVADDDYGNTIAYEAAAPDMMTS